MPVKTEVALSKKTWLLSMKSAKGAECHAIETGRLLKSIKENTKNKKPWAQFIEENYDGFFSLQHADRLIRIYDNRYLVVIASNGVPSSINGSIEFIRNATEEQINEAEKIKSKSEELARIEAIDKKAKAELDEKKKKEGWGDKQVNPVLEKTEKKLFEKTKPDGKAKPEEGHNTAMDELDVMLDEQFLNNKILAEENASLVKVFEASDQLAAAISEAKKYRDQVAFLNTRINQLIIEKNEAIQYAKMFRKKYEKLEMSLNM